MKQFVYWKNSCHSWHVYHSLFIKPKCVWAGCFNKMISPQILLFRNALLFNLKLRRPYSRHLRVSGCCHSEVHARGPLFFVHSFFVHNLCKFTSLVIFRSRTAFLTGRYPFKLGMQVILIFMIQNHTCIKYFGRAAQLGYLLTCTF